MDIETTPTIQLIGMLSEAKENGSQSLVNIIAEELGNRLWIPESKKTYEETIAEFGYFEEPIKKLERTR